MALIREKFSTFHGTNSPATEIAIIAACNMNKNNAIQLSSAIGSSGDPSIRVALEPLTRNTYSGCNSATLTFASPIVPAKTSASLLFHHTNPPQPTQSLALDATSAFLGERKSLLRIKHSPLTLYKLPTIRHHLRNPFPYSLHPSSSRGRPLLQELAVQHSDSLPVLQFRALEQRAGLIPRRTKRPLRLSPPSPICNTTRKLP